MPQAKVIMNVRQINSTTAVIDIEGEVSAFAENIMMEAYTQASLLATRNIGLNFEKLEYMNSSGIGLLVTLLIRANRHKQRLLVYGLNEHYRHIFELTRLNEAFSVYETEDQALNAS